VADRDLYRALGDLVRLRVGPHGMARTRNASELSRAVARAGCVRELAAVGCGWVLLAFSASFVGTPPSAAADDVQVDSETTLQAYDVASPATSVVWARRRLTQSLGLGYVKALAEAKSGAPTPSLQLHVRLRLNQEFGSTCLPNDRLCFAVIDPERRGSYTPLVDDGYIDLPYAYVETRDGPLGSSARLGRQLHSDMIGFARVDGVSARAEPAAWLAFETVFGALVRSTSFAGSEAFVPSSLPRLDLSLFERQRSDYIAPPAATWLGAALVEVGRESSVRVRAGYRSVQQDGGLLERRFGLGLSTQPSESLRFAAHGVLDALALGLIDAQFAANLIARPWYAGLQLERHEPRFEPASIWAYFDVAPMWLGSLRMAREFGPAFEVAVAGRARRTELAPRPEHELGADLSANFHDPRDTLSLNAFGWAGGTGPLWGAAASATRRITRVVRVEAELSLMRIDDPLRAALAGVSMYELLAAYFAVTDESEVQIAVSHAHSRAAGQRLSVLAFLHLGAWR
jgi:hypothetical protein